MKDSVVALVAFVALIADLWQYNKTNYVKNTPLQYTNETADVSIVGAIFLLVRFEQTRRSYSSTIGLFATTPKNNICIALLTVINNHVLVVLLRVSPNVEYRCQ